jgi:hypothetical protein
VHSCPSGILCASYLFVATSVLMPAFVPRSVLQRRRHERGVCWKFDTEEGGGSEANDRLREARDVELWIGTFDLQHSVAPYVHSA